MISPASTSYDLAFLLMDLIEKATVPPPPAC